MQRTTDFMLVIRNLIEPLLTYGMHWFFCLNMHEALMTVVQLFGHVSTLQLTFLCFAEHASKSDFLLFCRTHFI